MSAIDSTLRHATRTGNVPTLRIPTATAVHKHK